jgi:hypothetical protein
LGFPNRVFRCETRINTPSRPPWSWLETAKEK